MPPQHCFDSTFLASVLSLIEGKILIVCPLEEWMWNLRWFPQGIARQDRRFTTQKSRRNHTTKIKHLLFLRNFSICSKNYAHIFKFFPNPLFAAKQQKDQLGIRNHGLKHQHICIKRWIISIGVAPSSTFFRRIVTRVRPVAYVSVRIFQLGLCTW